MKTKRLVLKKMMLIICIAIAFLQFGCEERNTTKNTNTTEGSDSQINIYNSCPEENRMEDFRINKWETYILDKYNIDLIYRYFDISNSTQDINLILDSSIENNPLDGFVYIQSLYDLNQFIKEDLLLPLNNHYQVIAENMSIDQSIFSTYSDGTYLWAIPVLNVPQYTFRIYSKEMLDLSKFQCPTNIEDFYLYGKHIKNTNSKDNEIVDSYLFDYTYDSIVYDVSDILRAFGCYSNDNNPIGYNPKSNRVENIIFNSNFADAIKYIEILKDEGLIIERNHHMSYKTASSQKNGFDFSKYENIIKGYYLQGPNEEFLIEQTTYPACIAVLKQTDNLLTKLETFYTNFKSQSNAASDFYIGIQNEDYIDGGAYILYQGINGNSQINPIIGIHTAFFYENLKYKPIIPVKSFDKSLDYIKTDVQKFTDLIKSYSITSNIDNAKKYTLPIQYFNNNTFTVNRKVVIKTNELFFNILENNHDIDISIDNYRKSLENLGIISEINQINAKFFND